MNIDCKFDYQHTPGQTCEHCRLPVDADGNTDGKHNEASVELQNAIFTYAANRVWDIWSLINQDSVMPDFRNNEEYNQCVAVMAKACHRALQFAIDTQDTTD